MQTILLKNYQYWYQNFLQNFLQNEEGATAIEYGLMAALIGATVLTAQAALGSAVNNMYVVAMDIITGALGS